MDPVAFNLGPFAVTWYAIFIVFGLLLGAFIAAKESTKQNLKEEDLYDMLFYLLIFSFLGARTWYVLFDGTYYLDNPSEIIKIWNGGLAIHGGIVGGASYLLYYAKKRNLNPFTLTDLAAPSLILGQAIGRWGNFMNGEAHGGETTFEFLKETLHLPNFIVEGMHIGNRYYHPTFLYESIWNLIGFAIIMLVIRPKYRLNPGIITGFYLMWYGFIRTFIEMMRTDALMFGPVKVAQLTSIAMFIAGIFIIAIKRKGETNE